MEPEPQKHVLVVAVQQSGTTWLRSLCVSNLPKKEDVVFYYQRLCGFREAVVSVAVHAVPVDFQDSLFAAESAAFPKHHVAATTEERIAEYRDYVYRVCEAERFRSRITTENAATAAAAEEAPVGAGKKRKNWASELLSQLNTLESTSSTADHLAWMITSDATKGSRFIVDKKVGVAWESRLGTALYPDLVVTRCFNTASWAFQHPSSVSLFSATLAWYLAVRGVAVTDGVSGWIQGAESDLLALTGPFASAAAAAPKKTAEDAVAEAVADAVAEAVAEEAKVDAGKPLNTMLHDNRPSLSRFSKIKATPPKPIVILLQKIEQSMLFSKMEKSDVEPLSEPTFHRFLSYMARGHGIHDAKEDELVVTTVRRWVTAQMGFSAKTKPILESWNALWDTLMSVEGKKRNAVTVARVDLLLRTLDAWDACESAVMTDEQRATLLEDWMAVYRDRELVAERGSKTPFEVVESDLSAYLDKFLPRSLVTSLQKRFRDLAASVFGKQGYSAAILSGTLCLIGARIAGTRTGSVTKSEKLTKTPKSAAKPVVNTVSTATSSKITVASDQVVDLGSF